MISRTTWQLLLAVLLVAAYLWFVERDSVPTEEVSTQARRVWRIDAERVTYLALESEDFLVECEKRRDGWFLAVPLHARMDGGRVKQILNVLEDLPRIETITPAQLKARNLTLGHYELLHPRIRIVVGTDARREELLIGCNSPAGEATYVKRSGQEEIIATSTNLLSVLPQTVEELRERRFVYRDASQAVRLEIQRPEGFLQLSRKDGKWMLQQPVSARADDARVEFILNALSTVMVEEFIADSRAVDPVAYHLSVDDAVAQAALWWKGGDEIGVRLFFGKATEENAERIYARRGDLDSICTVRRDILDTLVVKAQELRDKALFMESPEDVCLLAIQQRERRTVVERAAVTSAWSIVEPVQCKADDALVMRVLAQWTGLRVESFLEGASTNLARYGLQEPRFTIELGGAPARTTGTAERVEGGPVPAPVRMWSHVLRLGRASANDGSNPDLVYGMLEGDRMLFEVDLRKPGVLWEPGGSPSFVSVESVRYRDRHVLRLPPASVRRIARAIPDQALEQVVEKNSDGKWIAATATAVEVRLPVVENLLRAVADLQAAFMVDDRPGQESRYGLDRPQLRLTFGLAGEGAIQKTLLLGTSADAQGGVYAMVQGQDLIFVLNAQVAECLRREILP